MLYFGQQYTEGGNNFTGFLVTVDDNFGQYPTTETS